MESKSDIDLRKNSIGFYLEGGQDIKRKMEKALFLNWKMEKA